VKEPRRRPQHLNRIPAHTHRFAEGGSEHGTTAKLSLESIGLIFGFPGMPSQALLFVLKLFTEKSKKEQLKLYEGKT
jgi:hypothetical protein